MAKNVPGDTNPVDKRRWAVEHIEELEQSPTGERILGVPGSPEYGSPDSVARKCWDTRRWWRENVPATVGPCPVMPVRMETVLWLRRMTYRDPATGGHEPDDRIIELVRRYRSGATVRELAELAHVSKSSMGRILKGGARLPFDAADLPEIQAA